MIQKYGSQKTIRMRCLLFACSALIMVSLCTNATTQANKYYSTLDEHTTLPAPEGITGPSFTEWAAAPEPETCSYGPGNLQFNHDKIIDFIRQSKQRWDNRSDDQLKWLLSAHRGVYGKLYPGVPAIPENSKQAIIEAGARNFEIIELDMHLDGSGNLVLFHDYTTGRGTVNSEGDSLWNPLINPPVENGVNEGGVFLVNEVGGGGVDSKETGPSTYYPAKNKDYIDFSNDNSNQKILNGNPSVSEIENWTPFSLRGFDRNTHVFSDGFNGAPPTTEQEVLYLQEALNFIGKYYPGMVVVLDLRHKDEVLRAIQMVDRTVNCKGEPARNWVIFKPFANAFPDGLSEDNSIVGQGEKVLQNTIANWQDYYWIPVLSGRLLKNGTPGTPSVHPGELDGPDVSTINITNEDYLRNWLSDRTKYTDKHQYAIVGFEVANIDNLPEFGYELIDGLSVTSWRPPDVRQRTNKFPIYRKNLCTATSGSCEIPNMYTEVATLDGYVALANINGSQEVNKCLNNSNFNENASTTIIGYNWKDDGLGKYPVTANNYNCLENIQKSQVLTVDDADRVMQAFRGETRERYLHTAEGKQGPLSGFLRPLTGLDAGLLELIID